MASFRRTKTFTPDAQTTRFLYLILKQLDLKSINWQEVADNLGIKNGHAARMRWSRFKQHAEGTPPQPKASKPKKSDGKAGNGKRDRADEGDLMKADDDRNEKKIKLEHGAFMQNGFPVYNTFPPMPYSIPSLIKPEPSVKQEPGMEFQSPPAPSPELIPGPCHWQSEPSPITNIPPVQTFSVSATPDGDIDDVPIKQLISPLQATVSMAELQLCSPIKSEFGLPNGATLPDITSTGPPAIEEASNCHHVSSSSSPPPASQPADSVQPAPASTLSPDETLRSPTPPSASRPTQASISPPTPVPALSSPPSVPFQPRYPPYIAANPPLYRPQAFPQPYHPSYGHPTPYPLGDRQRTMMFPFNPAAMYSNYGAILPQQAHPQQHMMSNVLLASQCGQMCGVNPIAPSPAPQITSAPPQQQMGSLSPRATALEESRPHFQTQNSPQQPHHSVNPAQGGSSVIQDKAPTELSTASEAAKESMQLDQKSPPPAEPVAAPQSSPMTPSVSHTDITTAAQSFTPLSPVQQSSEQIEVQPRHVHNSEPANPPGQPPQPPPHDPFQNRMSAQPTFSWFPPGPPHAPPPPFQVHPPTLSPSQSHPHPHTPVQPPSPRIPSSFTAATSEHVFSQPPAQVQVPHQHRQQHHDLSLNLPFDFHIPSALADKLSHLHGQMSTPMEPQFLIPDDTICEGEGKREAEMGEKDGRAGMSAGEKRG